MVSKYKTGGWHRESQRHSLARRGISTKKCSITPWKYNFPPYRSIVPDFKQSIGIFNEKFRNTTITHNSLNKNLLDKGWNMRQISQPQDPVILEVWNGKNYLKIVPALPDDFDLWFVDDAIFEDKCLEDETLKLFEKVPKERLVESNVVQG